MDGRSARQRRFAVSVCHGLKSFQTASIDSTDDAGCMAVNSTPCHHFNFCQSVEVKSLKNENHIVLRLMYLGLLDFVHLWQVRSMEGCVLVLDLAQRHSGQQAQEWTVRRPSSQERATHDAVETATLTIHRWRFLWERF
jgi:hypothetical protein